jgi:hypothetical protein
VVQDGREGNLPAKQGEAMSDTVYCGRDCSCLTDCGDFYESHGLPKPKRRQPSIDELIAANTKLVGALDLIQKTLNGANVQDLEYIINTALQANREALR